MPSDELRRLRERVKGATGPDLDLSYAILRAVLPDFHASVTRTNSDITGSLDAAVALCERVLPGCNAAINFFPPMAWVAQPSMDTDYQKAATPALALVAALLTAIIGRASLPPSPNQQAAEHVTVEYDGFSGDVIGTYRTREGKEGVVVQQDGTRVVHVYGRQRVASSPSPPPGLESGE